MVFPPQHIFTSTKKTHLLICNKFPNVLGDWGLGSKGSGVIPNIAFLTVV